MKKAFSTMLLSLVLVSVISFSGCNRVGSSLNGSGKIIDREIELADFNSLNIKGPFILEIKKAESLRVTISTDDNLIGRVRASLERNTLKMSIEAPASFFPTKLLVKIAMPRITSVNLSGEARATISGFSSTDDFIVYLADGSTLEGSLEAGIARFHLSGGSQISLQGASTRLELESGGGSKLNLADFILDNAQVKLRGASEATLNVEGRFDVSLTEASKIYYLGNPLFTDTSITGGSTMEHK